MKQHFFVWKAYANKQYFNFIEHFAHFVMCSAMNTHNLAQTRLDYDVSNDIKRFQRSYTGQLNFH